MTEPTNKSLPSDYALKIHPIVAFFPWLLIPIPFLMLGWGALFGFIGLGIFIFCQYAVIQCVRRSRIAFTDSCIEIDFYFTKLFREQLALDELDSVCFKDGVLGRLLKWGTFAIRKKNGVEVLLIFVHRPQFVPTLVTSTSQEGSRVQVLRDDAS